MIKLVKLTFINKTTEFAIVYGDVNIWGSRWYLDVVGIVPYKIQIAPGIEETGMVDVDIYDFDDVLGII